MASPPADALAVCTLALLLGASPRFPLLLAANRDERFDRPSAPPERWSIEPDILAGRDLLAGGSWLGVNANGLVAGLTNLWQQRPPDPNLASRGRVVLDLLAQPTLQAAYDWMAAQQPGHTNPFLAICADRQARAFWAQSEDSLQVRWLEPGIHVFGNLSPLREPAKSAAASHDFRLRFAARASEAPDDILAALRPALAKHSAERGPLDSVCVHTSQGFGTVSSSCILLGERESAYFHAPGPPCVTEFESYSEALQELLGH